MTPHIHLPKAALFGGLAALLATNPPPALADAPARTPGAHACQAPDAPALTCELKDGRLLSLCGSPGFSAFNGKAEAHPGYAYVAIGKGKNTPRFTYPPDPKDYRKHMFFWVSRAAVPHMFVVADRNEFLHFTIDPEKPVDANHADAPAGWPFDSSAGKVLCAKGIERDDLDPFMAQMPREEDWKKARGSGGNR